MPHYVDGTVAKVGDVVRGKPYNFGREVVGTVIQIDESESCNLVVAFAKIAAPAPEVVDRRAESGAKVFSANDGRKFTIEPEYDYGETKAFALINRPADEQ